MNRTLKIAFTSVSVLTFVALVHICARLYWVAGYGMNVFTVPAWVSRTHCSGPADCKNLLEAQMHEPARTFWNYSTDPESAIGGHIVGLLAAMVIVAIVAILTFAVVYAVIQTKETVQYERFNHCWNRRCNHSRRFHSRKNAYSYGVHLR